MKTIVLFFFVIGIVMLTVGYNQEVLKRKEAEIHTVEYRYMPHNLYELQMNPELGNQSVESNFQQMFEGQSPFFDEDTSANRAQIIRENNRRRREEEEKQQAIIQFLDILFAFIGQNSDSEIPTEDYQDLRGTFEEILNEFDILAVARNQVFQHKQEILRYLNQINNSTNPKFIKLKRILRRFFTPQVQERIDTFLFKLFYGRVYRRSEDNTELVIVNREGEISFTPDEINSINPILVDLLNNFTISSSNRSILREYKNKLIDNIRKVQNFNQFKEKIRNI